MDPEQPVKLSRLEEKLFGGAILAMLLNERGLNKTGLDVKNMYKDLAITEDFDLPFQKYMGMTTEYLEQNLYDLLAAYFAI